MNSPVVLRVGGDVDRPTEFSFDQLSALDESFQIRDVRQLARQRRGDAVKLAGILSVVRPRPSVRYLNLHSSTDNFHASIPLEPVRDQAFLIYRLEGEPLSLQAGGPVRFFIPDHAACHTSEIDECANVKFVDLIELTSEKGFDNRPADEAEHAHLHAQQQTSESASNHP